jgi:hypothetical protein
MGNTYQSELKRWDVVAGLMETNGFTHLVDVDPYDGRTIAAVKTSLPDMRVTFDALSDDADAKALFAENTDGIAAADKGAPVDMVYIEANHTEDVTKHIQNWYPRIKPGGIMAIGNYRHEHGIPVMRAVAAMFALYAVNVMPDNVAVILK